MVLKHLSSASIEEQYSRTVIINYGGHPICQVKKAYLECLNHFKTHPSEIPFSNNRPTDYAEITLSCVDNPELRERGYRVVEMTETGFICKHPETEEVLTMERDLNNVNTWTNGVYQCVAEDISSDLNIDGQPDAEHILGGELVSVTKGEDDYGQVIVKYANAYMFTLGFSDGSTHDFLQPGDPSNPIMVTADGYVIKWR